MMRTEWWTEPAWWQVAAAVAQLVAALILVFVTRRYVDLTAKMVRAQIGPLVMFEFNQFEKDIVIGNDGVERVVDIAVTHDTVVYAGPPRNVPIATLSSGRRIPAKPRAEWWQLAEVSPGAVCRKGVDDVVANAGNLIRFNAEAHEKGNLSGFSSSERFQLYALIAFRLTYHREVDRRRYRDARRVLVLLSETGQPVPLDETLAGSLIKASEMPDRT